MRMTYELEKTTEKILNETAQKKLSDSQSHVTNLNNFVEQINTYIKEMKEEETEITTISAQFACYLKQNAMTPFNDAIDSHLNMLLKQEREKPSPSDSSIQDLENMKAKYARQKSLITEAMEQTGHSDVDYISDPGEVERLKEKLFRLKHNGPDLKMIFSEIRSRNEEVVEMQYMPVTQIQNRTQRC